MANGERKLNERVTSLEKFRTMIGESLRDLVSRFNTFKDKFKAFQLDEQKRIGDDSPVFP